MQTKFNEKYLSKKDVEQLLENKNLFSYIVHY